MRIVVEPSDYILRNIGDSAMMEVALTRLAARWPNALITVFSDVPDRFPVYAPHVQAVDAAGRGLWLRTTLVPRRVLPRCLRPILDRGSRQLRVRVPRVALALLSVRLRSTDRQRVRAHVKLLREADLVLATGMGGITDAFPEYAHELLETLATAQRFGAVTVMVGQGLGPITDPQLLSEAADVIRKLDLIALREDRAGGPLLEQLQVPRDRVLTTGDDAIQLALARTPTEFAHAAAIGINLRLSGYSGLNADCAAEIAHAIRGAAAQLGASLQAVPISNVPGEEDIASLVGLFDSVGGVNGLDGSAELDLDMVLGAIEVCRVMVTGSYHAAVFALALGVPAIGLAASPYYRDKFLGLAQQFGEGCDVALLGDSDAPDLAGMIVSAWERAPVLRRTLRDAASRQVAQAHEAYDRIQTLVDARSAMKDPATTRSDNQMVRYGSWRLGAATLYRAVRGRSDVARWANITSFEQTWGPRSEMIAGLIPAGSRVIEFGAGRRRLEALLPGGCVYTPSDLVDRGPGTLVVDLDDRPLPNLGEDRFDIAVFAGVFEYLHDFDDIPGWLARNVRTCIASYECATTTAGTLARLGERSDRLRNGWVTTYTETELVDLFAAAGLHCRDRRTWTTADGEERIFVFQRT